MFIFNYMYRPTVYNTCSIHMHVCINTLKIATRIHIYIYIQAISFVPYRLIYMYAYMYNCNQSIVICMSIFIILVI